MLGGNVEVGVCIHMKEGEDLKDAISRALGPEQRDPEDMLGILEND